MIEVWFLIFCWIVPGCVSMLICDCLSSEWKWPTGEEFLSALVIGGFMGLVGVAATIWIAASVFVGRVFRP